MECPVGKKFWTQSYRGASFRSDHGKAFRACVMACVMACGMGRCIVDFLTVSCHTVENDCVQTTHYRSFAKELAADGVAGKAKAFYRRGSREGRQVFPMEHSPEKSS